VYFHWDFLCGTNASDLQFPFRSSPPDPLPEQNTWMPFSKFYPFRQFFVIFGISRAEDKIKNGFTSDAFP